MIDDMRVYIANLGKYNEGELVGDWFSFPLDEEEIAERIGLSAEYEEYAIHDTDSIPMDIPEYISIEELNNMYELMEELPEPVFENLKELLSYFCTLEELVEHKDDIIFFPECNSMEDVARFYVEELGMLSEIPEYLRDYIDYAAYGRNLEINGNFIETSYGMCEILR